jgi:hypothetical protein
MRNSGKKIKFIDDLAGAVDKTDQLFSGVTGTVAKYEKKYHDPIVIPEYSQTIITGNTDAGSLHVTDKDRRIVCFEVNPVLKGNKKVFDKLGEEVTSKCVMKAWFDFFATRKGIDTFDVTVVPEEIQVSKQSVILRQRKQSHMFLERMMGDPDFLRRYHFYGDNIVDITFIENQPKERQGQVRIRIEQTALYDAYKTYLDVYTKGAAKARYFPTFKKEVEQLGIIFEKRRLRIRSKSKKTFNVCDLYWEDYQKAFKRVYKSEPPLWVTEDRTVLEDIYLTLGKSVLKNNKNETQKAEPTIHQRILSGAQGLVGAGE